jgi:hypothetical protein
MASEPIPVGRRVILKTDDRFNGRTGEVVAYDKRFLATLPYTVRVDKLHDTGVIDVPFMEKEVEAIT